jgi:hypothetical protein
MAAVTFAEAGERNTALEFMGVTERKVLRSSGLEDFLSQVGLADAKVRFVTAAI